MEQANWLFPKPSELSEEAFVRTYGAVYEHSPWVAERAWRNGIGSRQDTVEGLARAMADVLSRASAEEQLRLIRAHPDLAGKAALRGELTGASTREQAGAGLDACSPEELERFHTLNASYKLRFGFPFVMAVGGRTRGEILDAFARRIGNPPDVERAAAIEQINRIALLRLRAHAGEPDLPR